MPLVSGFAGEHPLRQIEAAAPAPYPLAGDIGIDGDWLSDAPHQVRDLEQSYDFLHGRAEQQIHLRQCRLTVASREDPTLVCQELSLTAERAQSNDRRCRYLRARAAAETKQAPLRDRPHFGFMSDLDAALASGWMPSGTS